MVVMQIRRQKSFQVPMVKDDDMVEQFSAKAADHPFNIGVLPGRGRRRDDLLDTRDFNPSLNALTINAITVS
jgi:hypothetical protein